MGSKTWYTCISSFSVEYFFWHCDFYKKKNYKKELDKIKSAVKLGNQIGLEVHAGHGITYESAKILSLDTATL